LVSPSGEPPQSEEANGEEIAARKTITVRIADEARE
jgi:hypothetical protein